MDEIERLRVLRSYAVLDMAPEPALDRIVALARLAFDAPTALISLVDEHRQWLKARSGFDACETDRDQAFCAHALPLRRGEILVVGDASADPRFADNPLVAGQAHIRFYAGAVLTSPDGASLGTLCVLDTKPRGPPTPLQAETLSVLAELVVSHLEARRKTKQNDATRQMLALAEAMSGVGHWRLDVSSGAVEWSDEVYRIHGVDRDSFDPTLDDALAYFDDADREIISERLEEAIRDRGGYAFHLGLRRADGERRQVVCKATCELDAAGAAVAVVGVFQDVTAQETLLREVREERERYRLLTQNATDVIATYTPDGTFTWLSPSIANLIGRAPDEMLGLKTYACIHPDDQAQVTAQFRALLRSGGASARIEYRALHRNGGAVWVEAHPSPVFDGDGTLTGFQDVVRDISARRAAQDVAQAAAERAAAALASAQESEARYRLLAENANDMISTSTLDSTVLFVTPAVRRLLGYEPEEIVGRRTLSLTHPDDVPVVTARFRALVLAGPNAPVSPYQFRGRHKDGRWIWLEGQPRVQFGAEGAPQVFQDVVRDITERRRVELELEEARVAAEAAAQAKADFLANMSHELRTPLTSIIGYTSLAAEQPELSALTRDYVRRVQTASRGLLGTVNDILDFSKLEAGEVAIHPRPTDVLAVCRDALDLFTPQAAAKDLRLEIVAETLPTLLIDPERLLQLLLNLIGNAVKFTEAGAVTVEAGLRNGSLRVDVRDTGRGIPAEALKKLFRRFSQVDGSSTRAQGGTGLGLAICKGLAERMGGSISVRSQVGEGSCFTIRLPTPEAPTPVGEIGGSETAADFKSLEALRVLVVDDYAANRELARLILEGAGAEVTEAVGGGDALATLAELPFDAVLLDLRMPDLDGAAVLSLLRAAPGLNAATPVVAYSADASEKEAWSGPYRFDGFVAKPVDPSVLLTAIEAAVRWDERDQRRVG